MVYTSHLIIYTELRFEIRWLTRSTYIEVPNSSISHLNRILQLTNFEGDYPSPLGILDLSVAWAFSHVLVHLKDSNWID